MTFFIVQPTTEMFTDDRFQMQSTVDKRGRKVQESKKSDDIKKCEQILKIECVLCCLPVLSASCVPSRDLNYLY